MGIVAKTGRQIKDAAAKLDLNGVNDIYYGDSMSFFQVGTLLDTGRKIQRISVQSVFLQMAMFLEGIFTEQV